MTQKNVSINSPFLPRDNKERFELIELYLTDLKRRLAILKLCGGNRETRTTYSFNERGYFKHKTNFRFD